VFVFLGLREEIPAASITEGSVQVHFIDVEQGNCVLVMTPGYSLLIDSGELQYSENVISYIKQAGITKLDYIIASHPHADHIGGMGAIINEFKPDKLFMPKIPDALVPTTQAFVRMLDAIEAISTQPVYARVGDIIDMGDAYIEILAPINDSYDKLNNFSVLAKLVHGNNSFLFTGDMEAAAENDVLNAGSDIKADVLHVAHHGSRTSSRRAFLEAADGIYAVISVGALNPYSHPHDEVIDLLSLLDYEILRSDFMGTIIFISDEAGLEIITEKGENS